MDKETVGVKLEPEIRERLEALGKGRRRSTGWLMKKAILRFLEQEEAAGKARRETLERWEAFEETGAHLAHGDVEQWLSSWGDDQERPPPAKTRRRRR